MEIEPHEAEATSEHHGRTYFFCSDACKEKFDRHPEQFVAGSPGSGVGAREPQERK
jgi:YHS domain-containing protein